MKSELKIDLLEVLVKHGVLPESYVRNEKINIEYRKLRDDGATGKAAREQLAEKYLISVKLVEYALYGKKKHG